MRARVPSTFLLVPGPWREPKALVGALANRGIAALADGDEPLAAGAVRIEIVQDDDLSRAFAWGRRGPLPEELIAEVAKCETAALAEVGLRLDQDPGRFAALGRALRDAGGVAVRMEASGAASAWNPWLEKLESGSPDDLYASAVVIVDDEGTLLTCGMHQFDLPDAQIAMDDCGAAMEWLDVFCIYQIAEQPVLASGHTFRPDSETPRRTLERWPDHRHGTTDGRHNPFGVWRLLPEAEKRLQASTLVPTIMPPLVAMLLAAERSAGRALSQPEVESMVSKSPAIMMTVKDALALERGRGYADIEPELAWEQWQIVRETR